MKINRIARHLLTTHGRVAQAFPRSALNAIEKANCTFCSYANGVIAYVREIAARTEQYWCPIKHARAVPAPHARYHRFLDYGDARGYRRNLTTMRHTLERPRV